MIKGLNFFFFLSNKMAKELSPQDQAGLFFLPVHAAELNFEVDQSVVDRDSSVTVVDDWTRVHNITGLIKMKCMKKHTQIGKERINSVSDADNLLDQ